jgi:DNA-binding transcriptional ArsR family regulator
MSEQTSDPQAEAMARTEERHNADRVLDSSALRALAHPLRVRIYNILSQYGPQTASSLAEKLGESSGSTSYHLRALAKHDLIRECEDKGTARERWWERPPGGVSFGTPESLKTPAGRAASQLVMSEFLRTRNEQLIDFVTHAGAKEDDTWHHGTLVSTATARLTPEQSKELTLKIMAIIDEYVDAYRNQTGEGVRPITIRADVFPLPTLGESS